MNQVHAPPDIVALLSAGEPLTLSRVGAALGLLFFAPGDWLLWAMLTYASPVAALLGLSAAAYGGVLSGVVSALAWGAVMVFLIVTCSAVRELDQALTYGAIRMYREAGRHVRVIRNRVLTFRAARRVRRAAVRREPYIGDGALSAPQEIDVSVAELRVLHEHARLPDGHALTLGAAAAVLGARKSEARVMLDRLTALKLLTVTAGARQGDTAYALSSAGRAYLAFRRAAGAKSA